MEDCQFIKKNSLLMKWARNNFKMIIGIENFSLYRFEKITRGTNNIFTTCRKDSISQPRNTFGNFRRHSNFNIFFYESFHNFYSQLSSLLKVTSKCFQTSSINLKLIKTQSCCGKELEGNLPKDASSVRWSFNRMSMPNSSWWN